MLPCASHVNLLLPAAAVAAAASVLTKYCCMNVCAFSRSVLQKWSSQVLLVVWLLLLQQQQGLAAAVCVPTLSLVLAWSVCGCVVLRAAGDFLLCPYSSSVSAVW